MTDSQDQPRLRFGPFELDTRTSELRRGSERVPLPPQPVRVLALLASRPSELVTRQEIRDAIWGDDVHVDFDRALNFTIKQIREAIGDDSDRPVYIETLRGRGYRFIAAIEPTAPPQPPAVAERTDTVRPGSRSGVWMVVAAAAAVTIVATVWLAAPRNAPPATNASIRSVVVLPVVNLSGAADREFLADGMTDEIIGQLSRLPALRVISRTSAMAYKDVKKTIPTIARELGVDAIVEGALQEKDGVLNLTLTLRNAREQLIWTNSYTRSGDATATLPAAVARDRRRWLAWPGSMPPARIAASTRASMSRT
jgi:DNA-binding winged helix-turn-helix (wHTH) protein/TolB-like protein